MQESIQINEALKSSILNDLVKQLKEKNARSFKSFLGDTYRIRMSEVTDDDFEIFNGVKFSGEMVEFLTNIIKGIMSEDKYYLTFVREPNNGEFLWFIDCDGNFRGLTDDNSITLQIGWQYENYKVSEKKNFVKGNDLYCLPITEKQRNRYNELANKRWKSKEGVVDLSPEGLKKAAEANVERYKEILANNALDRQSVSDKLIDKVYNLVDDVNKLARRAVKNWNRYDHEDWKHDATTALNQLVEIMNSKDNDNYYSTRSLDSVVGDGDYKLLANLDIYAKQISKYAKDDKEDRLTHYIKKYRDKLLASYNDCKKAYDVISSKID